MTNVNLKYEITETVLAGLSGTPYACTELVQLSGGTANFLYRGVLAKPLAKDNGDGDDDSKTTQVVIKHAEMFVKSNPVFPLSTERCMFEQAALQAIRSGLGPITEGQFTVKTPQLLHFDPETFTQVHGYCSNMIDLKTYTLKFLLSSPTAPEATKEQCRMLGKSLGSWLRGFHSWAANASGGKTNAAAAAAAVRETAKKNVGMQGLKNTINYVKAVQMAETYPTILGSESVVTTLEEIVEMTTKEMENDSKLGVIHGDFWTGNVLIPAKTMGFGDKVAVNVVDWEMIQMGVRALDLGQMIAELYLLKQFKDIDVGVWIIDGFCQGYGALDDDDEAFRVAVHVGIHLIAWSGTPGWGSEKQIEGVISTGRDIAAKAWKKDRAWFDGIPLSCLFRHKSPA